MSREDKFTYSILDFINIKTGGFEIDTVEIILVKIYFNRILKTWKNEFKL